MSDFGDKFTSQGIVKLLDRLGDSITYTPAATGTAVTRTAIFNPLDSAGHEARGLFHIASDGTTGVAAPARGDRITFNSDVWTVVEIHRDKIGAWELTATLPEGVS